MSLRRTPFALRTFSAIDHEFRSGPSHVSELRIGRRASLVVLRDPVLVGRVLRDSRGFHKIGNSPFQAVAAGTPFTSYGDDEHLPIRRQFVRTVRAILKTTSHDDEVDQRHVYDHRNWTDAGIADLGRQLLFDRIVRRIAGPSTIPAPFRRELRQRLDQLALSWYPPGLRLLLRSGHSAFARVVEDAVTARVKHWRDDMVSACGGRLELSPDEMFAVVLASYATTASVLTSGAAFLSGATVATGGGDGTTAEQCVLRALELFPPAWLLVRRRCPEASICIGSYEECIVALSLFHANQILGQSEVKATTLFCEEDSPTNPRQTLTFGIGSRACPFGNEGTRDASEILEYCYSISPPHLVRRSSADYRIRAGLMMRVEPRSTVSLMPWLAERR
jgi:hypothetical protein